MKLLTSIFSLTTILVLFAFSGMLKWMPLIPVDTTVLFGGLTIVILVCCVLSNNVNLELNTWLCILIILMFYTWYLSTAVYTVSASFWKHKMLSVALNVIALLTPVFYLNSQRRFEQFERSLIFVSLLTISGVLLFYFSGEMEYLLQRGHNSKETKLPDYLSLATVVALGVIILFCQRTFIGWLLAALGIFVLVILTGRGPLLFCCLILVLIVTLNIRKRIVPNTNVGKHLKLAMWIIVIYGVYWTVSSGAADALLSRFAGLIDPDQLRISAFSKAFSTIAEYPVLGTGIGGYGFATYGDDIDSYPHNLFIEAFAETGIVGFALFTFSVFLCCLRTIMVFKTSRCIMYIGLVGFMFLNYMKSGGFIGARDLFLVLGAFLAYVDFQSRQQRLAVNVLAVKT